MAIGEHGSTHGLTFFLVCVPIMWMIAPVVVVVSSRGGQDGRRLSGDPIADVQALLQVSQMVSNDPQNALGSWDGSNPNACGWQGIRCNSANRVTAVFVTNKQLEGVLSPSFGYLSNLVTLDLRFNRFSGNIPAALGACPYLQTLVLASNLLVGSIPSELFAATHLSTVSLSNNMLSGGFPRTVLDCGELVVLSLDNNMVNGAVPPLTSLTHLKLLNLQNNRLTGTLPNMDGLRELMDIDVSVNMFSGGIPLALEDLPKVRYLNVSSNNLAGPIPDTYFFRKFPKSAYDGNDNLCGVILRRDCSQWANSQPPPTAVDATGRRAPFHGAGIPSNITNGTPSTTPSPPTIKLTKLAIILIPSIGGGIVLVGLGVALCCAWSRSSQNILEELRDEEEFGVGVRERLNGGYLDAEVLKATNGFDRSNVVAEGRRGTVFKGVSPRDKTPVAVAVKRLRYRRNEIDDDTKRRFWAECQVLKRVTQHIGLVRVLDCCVSSDLLAYILEFMPNGNLECRLYERKMSWADRLNAAVSVAYGLVYLHHDCKESRIFCDLKPSHILFDNNAKARIADIRIPRFVPLDAMRGTPGYCAPEFVDTEKATIKSDVYSFGIILLEMLTRKKPRSILVSEGIMISSWVREALVKPQLALQIFDVVLLQTTGIDHQMLQLLDVAMSCTHEMPSKRPSMPDVLKVLMKIQRDKK